MTAGHPHLVERARLDRRVHDARRVAHRRARVAREPVLRAVAPVQRGHVRRHRAVEIDGNLRADPALGLQPVHEVQERLRAPDRERRDDHLPAAGDGAVDHVGERQRRVARLVRPVAVRGLDHQPVGGLDRGRRLHDRIGRASQVAREHGPRAARVERDDRRAEDVPGRQQRRLHARGRVHAAARTERERTAAGIAPPARPCTAAARARASSSRAGWRTRPPPPAGGRCRAAGSGTVRTSPRCSRSCP